jgi:phosphohistidine phosphatase
MAEPKPKTLLLVRHAKAGKSAPGMHDRDRPLDDRGRRDAPKMGMRLVRRGARPDLILSSPALRAFTTAQLFAAALGIETDDIVVDARLYASAADTVLGIIQGVDDAVERLMVVGHNPELSELAHRLASQIDEMPTCSVAEFEFSSAAWADVGRAAPAKAALDEPED